MTLLSVLRSTNLTTIVGPRSTVRSARLVFAPYHFTCEVFAHYHSDYYMATVRTHRQIAISARLHFDPTRSDELLLEHCRRRVLHRCERHRHDRHPLQGTTPNFWEERCLGRSLEPLTSVSVH